MLFLIDSASMLFFIMLIRANGKFFLGETDSKMGLMILELLPGGEYFSYNKHYLNTQTLSKR